MHQTIRLFYPCGKFSFFLIYLSNYTELLEERILQNYVCSSFRKTNLIRTDSNQGERKKRPDDSRSTTYSFVLQSINIE
jgi:hypothetical protein